MVDNCLYLHIILMLVFLTHSRSMYQLSWNRFLSRTQMSASIITLLGAYSLRLNFSLGVLVSKNNFLKQTLLHSIVNTTHSARNLGFIFNEPSLPRLSTLNLITVTLYHNLLPKSHESRPLNLITYTQSDICSVYMQNPLSHLLSPQLDHLYLRYAYA